MRSSFAMAALACAVMLPLSGTATAATASPIDDAKLIANPLYEAGPLPATSCTEKPIKRNDKALARAYINGVVACLDRTWGRHLKAAGLPFRKITVKHVAKIPKKYCGYDIGDSNSQSYYCPKTGTLVFQLGADWLDDAGDMWLFNMTAAMYGIHVQNLVGIEKAYLKLTYANKSEMYEQDRRVNLQSDCLGGAFVRSVWPMKGRSAEDWQVVLGYTQTGGDEPGEPRWLGKGSTRVAWTKNGYAEGDPAACNTWAAEPADVA
ncbi:neutral zinc metallopeptidase [Nonomuraea mangrovi]|uniref:Neutral zinc metallopeptidase n=1 Tax=Nonomuraea mangrovi TaxID=2316207 RepID=A0ABW4TBJ6_9ACTN